MASSLILQPTADLVLLLDILKAVTLVVYVPAMGMILGTSSVAFVLGCMARHNQDIKYLHLAHKILKKLQLSSGLNYLYCCVPILSLAMIYAQTMYGTESAVGTTLLVCFAVSVFGTYFLNSYIQAVDTELACVRYLENLSSSESSHAVSHELSEKRDQNAQVQGLFGSFGIVGLMLATLFTFAAMDIIFHPGKWEGFTIVTLTLSVSMWMQWFWFLCAGFALAGVAIAYIFSEEDCQGCMSELGRKLALWFALALPALSFVNAICLPAVSWSSLITSVTLASLVFLTLGVLSLTEANLSKASAMFVLCCLLATTTADALKLTLIFRQATHEHVHKIMKADAGHH